VRSRVSILLISLFSLGFIALGSEKPDLPASFCQEILGELNVMVTHQVTVGGKDYPVEVPFNRTNLSVTEILPSYLR